MNDRQQTRQPATRAAWLALLAATLPLPPSNAGAPGRLVLTNGDHVSGHWHDSGNSDAVSWRAAFAEGLYEFPLDSVDRFVLTGPAPPNAPGGGFGFELSGGDLLHGDLLAIGPEWLVVDLAGFAEPGASRQRLRRASVRSIYRRGSNREPIYTGPRGLAGWSTTDPGAWQAEGGGFSTEQRRASARLGLDLPDRLRIDVELSWRERAAFVFELGDFGGEARSDDQGDPPAVAFALQVVDGWLIATRELGRAADVSPLVEVGERAGRTRLILSFDQTAGLLLVETPAGDPLARLKVLDESEPRPTGVRLTNLNGDVRLEGLRVERWNRALESADRGESVFVTDDGSVFNADPLGYDPAAKAFTLRPADDVAAEQAAAIAAGQAGDDDAVTVAGDRVAAIVFPDAKASPEPQVAALLHSGERISGRLLGVVDGRLLVESAALESPCSVPLQRVRVVFRVADDGAAPDAEGTDAAACLIAEGCRVQGAIGQGPNGKPTGLFWKPLASVNALPITDRATGRIVLGNPEPAAERRSEAARLYLRSGDCLPCSIESIDDRGVRLASPHVSTRFYPSDRVKAIELVTAGVDGRMTSERRERLLTLPRPRRDDPPQHLLVSTEGDYLRCGLSALNSKTAAVVVGGERVRIDRSTIARIIWLDPPIDEGDGSEQAPGPPSNPSGPRTGAGKLRVQAARGDGMRLAFDLERVAPASPNDSSGRLLGASDFLGACGVGLRAVEELRFGDLIEPAEPESNYLRWVMRSAKLPRYQPEPADEEGPTGETPLIGKPAPEVDLPIAEGGRLVEGKRFRIADYRGQVLVLDFWATWCGPCMKAMPMIDRLGEEFANLGVRVAAINLEQQPEAIEATLNRLGISPLVAIDGDRSAAEKYLVGGIPHTVVIGRDGRVRRVFVGGGSGFERKLRQALEAAAGRE